MAKTKFSLTLISLYDPDSIGIRTLASFIKNKEKITVNQIYFKSLFPSKYPYTTWELKKNGIDVTLICDNMAASLMKDGKIDKVITGADRICANGDTANKIGTYNLAILCRYHKIPFYVAAPVSTFDLGLNSGKEITIEQRPPAEVTDLFFKKPVAAKGVSVFNPAFDVTPHELISAIITERGIIRKKRGRFPLFFRARSQNKRKTSPRFSRRGK